MVTFDSTVTKTGNAVIQGDTRDVGSNLAWLGFVIGPLVFLAWLGFLVAAVAAGLLLAALGARQVRAAEGLISHEPGATLLVGIGGTFLPLFLCIALFLTVVGAPLGLAIMFGLWPLVAFAGYLVTGIWIGEWILRQTSPTVVRERPYLAAVIGWSSSRSWRSSRSSPRLRACSGSALSSCSGGGPSVITERARHRCRLRQPLRRRHRRVSVRNSATPGDRAGGCSVSCSTGAAAPDPPRRSSSRVGRRDGIRARSSRGSLGRGCGRPLALTARGG